MQSNQKRSTAGPSPELKANIFSIMTWYWMGEFISKGNTKIVEAEDLYDMNPKETTQYCESLWNSAIEKAKRDGRSQFNVWRLLWDCFGIEYMRAVLFKPVWLVSGVLQVYILKELVKTVADTENFKWWWGTLLILGMFAVTLAISVTHHMLMTLSQKVGMKIRSTVSMAVFNKLLTTKRVSLIGVNSGEMLNVITNDTQKLLDAATYFHFAWFGVVEILTISILVIIEVGVSGVPGLVLALLTQPLQIWMARMSGILRRRAIQYTDKRVHLTQEVLNGIRVIKYNGWVLPFLDHILELRQQEMSKITKSSYIRSSTSSIKDSLTPLASLCIFGTYYGIHAGNFMPASKAFTVLALFGVLGKTFAIAPYGMLGAGEAIVAIHRLQNILNLDKAESSKGTDIQIPKDHTENALLAVNCSFSWDNGLGKKSQGVGNGTLKMELENGYNIKFDSIQKPDMGIILDNINISVGKGELIAICGSVGSGKSSLLLAILDEMKRLNGNLYVERVIAYVPQQPWILNDTVRQNILFTNHYDPERYQRTVAACALEQDISQFVGGHDAEIGERGINISGGQKARISLARACYSSAPVILLDDPFAAVDVATANHLIKHVLTGIIKGRTVILVTHNKTALSYCDRVYSMENGHLSETYLQKINTSEADCQQLDDSKSALNTERTSIEAIVNNKGNKTNSEVQKPEYEIFEARADEAKGRTTLAENSIEGKTQLSTWFTYVKASGGLFLFSVIILIFLIGQAVRVMVNYWLRVWTDRVYNLKSETYLASFAVFVVGATIFGLFRGLLFTKATMIATTQLHKQMAEKVLRAPQLFFDQNVAGRVLNRFSKDQALADEVLPNVAQLMLDHSVSCLGGLIFIAILIPWFLLVFPPFFLVVYYVKCRYITISRELKRLEATTRSPVYAHFSQTLQGIVSVRSYGTQSQMHKAFMSLIDANHRPFILFVHLQRWQGVLLDVATSVCVTVVAILVIVQRNSYSPGMAGVALVQSLQFAQFVQFAVRQVAETENLLTSVERIDEYANLPSEASPTTEAGIIDGTWPSRGEVEFRDYTMTYRIELPPVLNKLSFKVNAAEKIGILGRTGAGKSSLIAALFRMIENEKCSGDIYIDRVNVKLVGLDDIRRRLSIIPQDPVLFQGTVRFNLDPFQAYSDAEIHEALEKVHLTDKIKSLNKGLDSQVAQNGENFSLGQRQLICLARSLLRRSKIIVMDEATSSVDGETDSLIQKTIRAMFKECTVLTIAHRIDTVIDCDKVLLLKVGGVIAEFDSPFNLLENHQDGVFSEMVRQTGPTLSRKLYEAARGKELFQQTGKLFHEQTEQAPALAKK